MEAVVELDELETVTETEQVEDAPVPLRKQITDFLEAHIAEARAIIPDDVPDGDVRVGLPLDFVKDLAAQIYRIPEENRTLTIDFGPSDRHLLRTALGQHAEALEKEAKKLGPLGYIGMADRLLADCGRINDAIRPQFHEQREFELKVPEAPQLTLLEQSAVDAGKRHE